jgi:signal peptidase II
MLILAAAFVLAVDQATKALVLRGLAEGQAVPSSAAWPIRVRRISNTRPALGLICTPRVLVLAWGMAAIGVGALALGRGASSAVVQAALGSALGGATGNVLDRLRRGAVTDFVDLRIWPVFNLADAAIVVGTAVTVWALLTRAWPA